MYVLATMLQEMVSDSRGKQDNQLELWADAPRWEYSTAPLMDWDSGDALAPADPGNRGHSLLLNDQQVHLLATFAEWLHHSAKSSRLSRSPVHECGSSIGQWRVHHESLCHFWAPQAGVGLRACKIVALLHTNVAPSLVVVQEVFMMSCLGFPAVSHAPQAGDC